MSDYDALVGRCFSRNGVPFNILECDGAVVMAAALGSGRDQPVAVPLAAVLEALEVTEITVTELPSAPGDGAGPEAEEHFSQGPALPREARGS